MAWAPSNLVGSRTSIDQSLVLARVTMTGATLPMSDRNLLKLFLDDHAAWTRWRFENADVNPDFRGADLRGLNRPAAFLRGVNFYEADLSGAMLPNAELQGAYLCRAKLDGAMLSGAKMLEANLFEASLREANLSKAVLADVELRKANLTRANLESAVLSGSRLVRTILDGAILDGARVFGVSTWGVSLDGTQQKGLIVSDFGEPTISVDDLEIAQFIYLLMRSQSLRTAIDQIVSKVVLILGRFSEDRKPTLELVRQLLRKLDYVPIVFDFPAPDSRDVRETVSLLAHLARFVIADITEARTVPEELELIVPRLPSVPVLPILCAPVDSSYGMLQSLQRFPWVGSVLSYANDEALSAELAARLNSGWPNRGFS